MYSCCCNCGFVYSAHVRGDVSCNRLSIMGGVQEIDELCDDWQPEPLFSQLTEAQQSYEPPVVSRCAAMCCHNAELVFAGRVGR